MERMSVHAVNKSRLIAGDVGSVGERFQFIDKRGHQHVVCIQGEYPFRRYP